ncbi:MAG TPA: 5-oxoprolinase subunit PxpB [Xanthomonadaceae bacterium]|nr:5-oxoprolinase subunit PxpB [Xanthomonadaceae bacterium]
MTHADGPVIEALGESALLVRLGSRVDAGLNARVHALAARLRAEPVEAVVDVVPAYGSLAVHFDGGADPAGVRALVDAWLRARLDTPATGSVAAARTVEVPVCYGGEHGPDLEALSRHAGLEVQDVVARHAGADFRVAMLGFAPGFPYLLGLPAELAMPRLAQPRRTVPAGSVGIAEAQTGIYPQSSPGGWRLIGRTPLRLFDAAREPPSLLAPGDRVRFVAIEATRFDRWPAP